MYIINESIITIDYYKYAFFYIMDVCTGSNTI